MVAISCVSGKLLNAREDRASSVGVWDVDGLWAKTFANGASTVCETNSAAIVLTSNMLTSVAMNLQHEERVWIIVLADR